MLENSYKQKYDTENIAGIKQTIFFCTFISRKKLESLPIQIINLKKLIKLTE